METRNLEQSPAWQRRGKRGLQGRDLPPTMARVDIQKGAGLECSQRDLTQEGCLWAQKEALSGALGRV